MFRLRVSESPMPTGSKDPDVLLAWLLDSMGLIRRKTEGASVEDEQGALHRMLRQTVLVDPLGGWDASALGDASGLSQTGVHHQLVKLRESGLLAANTEGRWHIHVLRGGSVSAAVDGMNLEGSGTAAALSSQSERSTEASVCEAAMPAPGAVRPERSRSYRQISLRSFSLPCCLAPSSFEPGFALADRLSVL